MYGIWWFRKCLLFHTIITRLVVSSLEDTDLTVKDILQNALWPDSSFWHGHGMGSQSSIPVNHTKIFDYNSRIKSTCYTFHLTLLNYFKINCESDFTNYQIFWAFNYYTIVWYNFNIEEEYLHSPAFSWLGILHAWYPMVYFEILFLQE